MHTSLSKNTYPVNCERCDEMFESEKDLKKHMKRHSYKLATWKCVECDFVGGCEETMHVHVGKQHSEKFECSLCDYEALTIEDLETHLLTSEIYECGKCKIKGKTMVEVKNHIESEHAEDKTTFFGFPSIYHKKWTENFVEVSSTKYNISDINGNFLCIILRERALDKYNYCF
jgi:uncharacterized C2H2 Zn-finger protein